jgi:hypothetical protein
MSELNEFPREKFDKWLSEQPKNRMFYYMAVSECLFASFAKEALGFKNPTCGSDFMYLGHGQKTPLQIDRELSAATDILSRNSSGRFTIAQFRAQLAKATQCRPRVGIEGSSPSPACHFTQSASDTDAVGMSTDTRTNGGMYAQLNKSSGCLGNGQRKDFHPVEEMQDATDRRFTESAGFLSNK